MTLVERLIRLHEGCRLYAYTCPSGKTTIGWGRNLDDQGVSRDEADLLLTHDIVRCEQALREALPWTAQLDVVRLAVLTDMVYNLGLAGLLRFKRTLASIEARDYPRAAGQMLDSRWAQQVGGRAKRLASMMATGTVPPEVAA